MYKKNHNMNNFSEPGKFLLAYNAKCLWTYFDTFKDASTKMNN